MADEQPETHGGGGKFFERRDNVRSDARLIEQAARNKWNIPAAAFDVLPSQVVRMAVDPNEAPRNRLAAARAVIAMHGQNQGDEQPQGTTVNVGVSVSVQNVRQELLNDANYLAFLRTRSAESDGDAGAVCEDGKLRALEVGKAPGDAGQGNNGHADGNGRH